MNSPFSLGADGIYRCGALEQFIWQKHGFGTRWGSPEADITLRQIHSNHVLNAHSLKDREGEGDALITNEAGRSIGIRTADCVPILLLDSCHRAVGAVHAGWRGTAAGIVRCAIEKMASDFGSVPADIYAAIGPCIRDCCYEVGVEVAQQFALHFPEWGQVTNSRTVDLAEANRRQMEQAGLKRDQIFDCQLCTACGSMEFFSYRREPKNPGRMVAAIGRLV
ncbi:MAG: peptidoglycan editing factor PgeF [Acidobacteriaceae bacterium]|nr:peptidoglycan editing factor PgeF [Acidobacteriaceae bacterium]